MSHFTELQTSSLSLLEDTEHYIVLLKLLRKMCPRGNIGVFSEKAAKEIALEMNYGNRENVKIQQTTQFLSENNAAHFCKLNEDIQLIEQGKEKDILPFRGVENFKQRRELSKFFESITQPGSIIKKLADYQRDAELHCPNIVNKKSRVWQLFTRKLLLSCLAVYYKQTQFKSNDEEFDVEFQAYKYLHQELTYSGSPSEKELRRLRKIFVKDYDFRKMFDSKKCN